MREQRVHEFEQKCTRLTCVPRWTPGCLSVTFIPMMIWWNSGYYKIKNKIPMFYSSYLVSYWNWPIFTLKSRIPTFFWQKCWKFLSPKVSDLCENAKNDSKLLFLVALTRFLFQPDFCSEIPRGSHLTLNHVNHMILNHLKWWAGSNKDPSFRFYFDLILKLSPSSVNVKSSQSESILDFTSEGLQAISSVSSIFNLQVHFISFKKLFYTFENYNFFDFCVNFEILK